MGIRNQSVPLGATITPSGGTATGFSTVSSNESTVRGFFSTSGVTPLTRTEVIYDAKAPRVNQSSPGGFTQGRASVRIATPKVLANLARTVNTVKVEVACDPETTSAELAALKNAAILQLLDGDLDSFWLNQSTD